MNKSKKTIKGQVKSDKMENTVIVEVHTYMRHPKYKKRYRVTHKYFAHNPQNKAGFGDTVLIEECRPMSRHKRWLVKEIITKASELVRAEAAASEAEQK